MSITEEVAMTFVIFCGISAATFLGWLIWNIFWSAYDALIEYLGKRSMRVPYSEVNAHKITPRFNVGSDAK